MEKDKKQKTIAVYEKTHEKLTDYQYKMKKEKGVKKSLDEIINELLDEKEQPDQQTEQLKKMNENFKKQLDK